MKPIYYVLVIVVLIAAALGTYKYFYAPSQSNISPTPTNTASPLAGTASPDNEPTTQEACENVGGEWVPLNRCILKTNDGGRACTDGSQCQGKVCIVEFTKEQEDQLKKSPNELINTKGKCTGWMTTLGCYTRVINGQAGLGTSLCAD